MTENSKSILSMRRRDFLLTTGTAIAGVAVLGDRALFASSSAQDVDFVSAGYWNATLTRGRDGSLLAAFRNSEVESAADLPAGDPGFISTSAIVSTVGLWRPESRRNTPVSLNVDLVYPIERTSKVRVHAWHFSGRQRSSASSLTLPLSLEQPMEIIVERSPGATKGASLPSVRDSSRLEFSMGHAEGLKLRPGVYFLAVKERDTDSFPVWRDVRVAVADGEAALSLNGDGLLRNRYSGRPVDFSYLVLTVDRSINIAPVSRVRS